MSPPPEIVANFLHLPPKTLGYGLPLNRESSILQSFSTNMRETKKVERFRSSLAPVLPVLDRKTAKLNQASLIRIHFQPKLFHALFKLPSEAYRILPVLESHDKVICIS